MVLTSLVMLFKPIIPWVILICNGLTNGLKWGFEATVNKEQEYDPSPCQKRLRTQCSTLWSRRPVCFQVFSAMCPMPKIWSCVQVWLSCSFFIRPRGWRWSKFRAAERSWSPEFFTVLPGVRTRTGDVILRLGVPWDLLAAWGGEMW